MKIFVKAKPNSREEKVEQIDETNFTICVKEPPVGGAANRAISRAIAEHFGVAPSRARLVSGFRARQKIFDVL